MNYVVVNGEVLPKKKVNLSSFLWEDIFILSGKVWYGYGGIPLFSENLEDLHQQLNALGYNAPAYLQNKRELFRLSKRMLNKNKFFRSGLITIRVFVSDKNINTLITSNAFENFDFPINEQGLLTEISEQKKETAYEPIPIINEQIFRKTANNNNKQNEFHEAIILNRNNKICEGTSGNIFMIRDNVLLTPSTETGCIKDTLRPIILQLAKQLNLKTIESEELAPEQLLQMDEVFFISEEYGIQWIMGIGQRRFVHQVSDKLHQQLNNYLKDKVN